MRTNFSATQLNDPALAAAEHELRACVHCGICTATCPTYVLLGDELDGPRGRIQLIQGMLESGAAPSAKVVTHIDRCLSCMACVSACPSGVNYPRLIDEARAHIEETYRRPWRDVLLRRALGFVLPRRWLLRWALTTARVAARFSWLVPEPAQAALIVANGLPRPAPAKHFAKTVAAQGVQERRIALHAGCVQEVIAPSITAAAIRVLTRFGAQVTIVEGSGCCGSLNHHLGETAAFARHANALIKDIGDAPFDAIATTASGCGATVRDYGFLLKGSKVAAQASEIGAKVRDICDVLLDLPLASPHSVPKLRVAYHAACSLTHGMRQDAAASSILTKLGFDVVTPSDTQCCGSAGVYNVLQPAIADELQARKAQALAALNADVIVTGNIGCLMQIASAVRTPVVHVVELIDWATGGPQPEALRMRLSV